MAQHTPTSALTQSEIFALASSRPGLQALADKAAALHAATCQTYGCGLPYAFHLRLTADYALRYAHLVITSADDLDTLLAGAWFHDTIEDARITYHDLQHIFTALNAEAHCAIRVDEAAELVFALTNDRGRTRAERAGEGYYALIRSTRFASFVKMCDRLANIRYSTLFAWPHSHMADTYRDELPHFLAAIGPVPRPMRDDAEAMLGLSGK